MSHSGFVIPNLAFPLNYENPIIAYNVLVPHSINIIPGVVSYNSLMCDLSKNLAQPNSKKEGVVNYNSLKRNSKCFGSLLQATGLKRDRERGISKTSF